MNCLQKKNVHLFKEITMAKPKNQELKPKGEYKASNKNLEMAKVYGPILTPTGNIAQGPATNSPAGTKTTIIPGIDYQAHKLAYTEAKKIKGSASKIDSEYEKAFKKYKSALSNK